MRPPKRILIAWEMGGNFGHAAEIAQLLRWLDGPHEVFAAVRNPATLRSILDDRTIRVLAAPHAPDSPATKGDPALNYPDVLRYVGWQDPDTLAAYLEAWAGLLDLVRPDVLVAQAAPTALLAARGLDIPKLAMGVGYCCPPLATPMPPFLDWQEAEASELERREGRVVEAVNAALDTRGIARISAFRDLLAVDRCLLTTLPELDHYANRTDIDPDAPPYLGPSIGVHFGASMAWRAGARYRVFGYLRPGSRNFEATLRALAALPSETDVILAAPGAPAALTARLAETPVRLVPGPVHYETLLADCDLGISHATSGLVANFACAGVPQIGMPTHTEQTMVAHAMSKSDLGLGLVGKAKPDQILRSIEMVRRSDKIARGSAAFARRWTPDQSRETSQIAARHVLSFL